MRGFNFNISSLFSNLGSGNAFGSFNFSDYASIKNGSYGKLVKSYYAEQKKTPGSDKATTTKPTKKEETVDKTGLSQMKKEAEGLKSAAEALNKEDLWKQTDGKYDMDKIVSAVKTFASEYNDTITQASKVNSKDVAQDVRYMSSMTSTMSKALSNIGISVDLTGKMSVNEETLKNAKMNDVKSLFSGAASYGKQIEKDAIGISSAVVMGSSIYNSSGIATSALSGMFDGNI